jgi:SagB-type dehydrogenase family enzyme
MNPSIGQAFLEGTKYQHLPPSDQQQGIVEPPPHHRFRFGRTVSLPTPNDTLGARFLRHVIQTRRSLRSYADTPLSIDELSFLLWSTQGVKPESTRAYTLRTVPSAGARHALETVLLANRVSGLDPGMYQYDAENHGLIGWATEEGTVERWMSSCLNQPMVRTSAVTFAWVADCTRMTWRYGERGLRYLFLDAGHVCQNLHLAAESISAGACAIGAFNDDEINCLLRLDGIDLFVVYAACVGKRPTDTTEGLHR